MSKSIFDGDGRVNVYPEQARECTEFLQVRGIHLEHAHLARGTARLVIRAFEAKGASAHSGRGAHVWVVVQHLLEQGRPFEVFGIAGEGFMVRATDLPVLPDAPNDVPITARI